MDQPGGRPHRRRARSIRVALAAVLAAMSIAPQAIGMTTSGGNPRPIGVWKRLPVVGEKSWVTLLCRFPDDLSTPHEGDWYRTLMTGDVPDYWREASFGKLEIDGEAVHGWYTLPNPRRYYFDLEGRFLRSDVLLDECAAQADADVSFPEHDGITVWVNGSLEAPTTGVARDGGRLADLSLDGQTKRYHYVFQSSDHERPFGYLARAMSASFTWSYSSSDGGFSDRTASMFDVTSGIAEGCHVDGSSEWCVPVHPVAQWKYLAGWVTRDEVVEVPAGASKTIVLDPLERAARRGRAHAVVVPIENSQVRYLVVEARRQIGFDARPPGTLRGIPGEGVLIHQADSSASDLVLLDDSPGDAVIVNDEALRRPGESFRHPGTGIEIEVVGTRNGGAYVVRVTSPALPRVPFDDFEDALPLDRQETRRFFTYAATTEKRDPVLPCTGRRNGHTAWFRFTPRNNGLVTFETPSHWVVVGAFAGRHGHLRNLGCSAQHNLGPSSIDGLSVRRGVTYRFEVASVNWWEGVPVTTSFRFDRGPVEKVVHQRFVRLEPTGHLEMQGNVTVADEWFGACTQRVPVDIVHLQGDEWRVVASVRTDDHGEFRVQVPDEPGNYEARAATTSLHGHQCESSSSGTFVHEHP